MRGAVEAGPLLAETCFQFKAIRKSGERGVLLEVIELPIGPDGQLLRFELAYTQEERNPKPIDAVWRQLFHRMMATWPVSGGMGNVSSFNSMT